MGNIESRIKKIEGILGKEDDLSFGNYFTELLQLISGRSRGLPSEEKKYDPEFEEAMAKLHEKYLTQKEPGLGGGLCQILGSAEAWINATGVRDLG